jgi:hypothetical protein
LAGMAMLVTQIAAAAAALTWMLADWVYHRKPTVLGIVSGAVAGLVAITPASGFVGPVGALAIGVIAGFVCYWGVEHRKCASLVLLHEPAVADHIGGKDSDELAFHGQRLRLEQDDNTPCPPRNAPAQSSFVWWSNDGANFRSEPLNTRTPGGVPPGSHHLLISVHHPENHRSCRDLNPLVAGHSLRQPSFAQALSKFGNPAKLRELFP